MRKCIFLDRDGVLNRERGEYTFKVEDFDIVPGVVSALKKVKEKGYLLIVITNQGGINKGLYSKEDVLKCHQFFQQQSDELIDDFFYCPYHDDFTNSLARKPDTLMLEKAIYKWSIDVRGSWFIGDSDRDIKASIAVGVKGLFVGNQKHKEAESSFENSAQALNYISSL